MRVTQLFGMGAGIQLPPASQATLRRAGIACNGATVGVIGTVLQRMDQCVVAHGVATAHTGSALADLLLLPTNSAQVTGVLDECRSYAAQPANG